MCQQHEQPGLYLNPRIRSDFAKQCDLCKKNHFDHYYKKTRSRVLPHGRQRLPRDQQQVLRGQPERGRDGEGWIEGQRTLVSSFVFELVFFPRSMSTFPSVVSERVVFFPPTFCTFCAMKTDCTAPFTVDIFFNNIDDVAAAARNDGIIPTRQSQGMLKSRDCVVLYICK